jgi:streptomycin 6-kinase
MSTFDTWLDRWSLVTDGSPIRTAYSDLLPVLSDDVPAMLKVARTDEERRGASLLAWYAGAGAVRVFEMDGPALLMERPVGDQSLVDLSKNGRDDEATRILCETVRRLHAARDRPAPSELVPLDTWFGSPRSTTRISSAIRISSPPPRLLSSPAGSTSSRRRRIWRELHG